MLSHAGHVYDLTYEILLVIRSSVFSYLLNFDNLIFTDKKNQVDLGLFMTNTLNVLGLDLGPTSIGWALLHLECDEDGKILRDQEDFLINAKIKDIGVRIFPATTDDKTKAPKNQKRRASRLQRRLVARKAQRRNDIRSFLMEHGLLPELSAATSAARFDELGDPFELRVRALDEKLEPHQIGRAIYHLAKRRGFLSNRKSGTTKEDGVVLGGIKEVREAMEAGGHRTLAEYLVTLPKKRKHFTHRAMTEDEFETIWNVQYQFHPDILTNELHAKLKNAIFYQRPLKLQRGLIGKCTFETDKKRCDIARQAAQRMRYWQDINNLAWQDQQTLSWQTLTQEQKILLAEEFEQSKEVSYKKLRKLLKLSDDININLDKKLYGNKTAYAFRKAIPARWDALNEEEQDRLTEDLFRIQNENGLRRRLKEFWQFSDEDIKKLEDVWYQLEDGYSRLSLKAINKVLPKMKEGLRYDQAVLEVYGDHRKQFGGDESQKLPLPPKDLRNPIVFKALCELRKVVNAVIREYGRPDIIRIEMARDLKLTEKQKEKAIQQNRSNEKANQEAAAYISQRMGISPENVSGTDKFKYRLWKESNERCPYTGKLIPLSSLFDDGVVDIEHIIPYSRCYDDSYMNKTICDAKFNREVKLNRAPGEIFDTESEEHYQLMQRISCLPRGKQRKFTMTAEQLNTTDWVGRQLSDTRYICREARGYLLQLFPSSNDENAYVQVVAGGATANLRRVWGINAILSDGDIDVKNRWDHRHHALDALVVALCDRGLYQMISKLAGRNRDMMRYILKGIGEPWRGFLDDVNAAAEGIVVSHAPTRRVRGQLLEDTAYGATQTPGVYVVKKALASITLPAIKAIVDKGVKELVELRLSQYGGDLKKAFADTLYHKDGKTPIRNVRCFVAMSPDTVVGIKDAEGKEYKYYPLAGNHHVDIFENIDTGERKAVLVPRFYAAKRGWKPADLGSEWNKLFSLCANDYVEFRGDKGELRILRIQKMSGGGDTRVDMRPPEDARSDYIKGTSVALTTSNGLRKIVRKLQVDPLGRLREAKD